MAGVVAGGGGGAGRWWRACVRAGRQGSLTAAGRVLAAVFHSHLLLPTSATGLHLLLLHVYLYRIVNFVLVFIMKGFEVYNYYYIIQLFFIDGLIKNRCS